MSILTISANLPDFSNIIKAVEEGQQGKLPYTQEAVRAALTDLVQRTWIQYASGATVTYSGGSFVVHVVSGAYVRSIQDGFRMDGDQLAGEIFTTSPYGAQIEDGIKPYDMKAKLLSSPKAKIGKNGNKYITVPFRHGTPGAKTLQNMPKDVYKEAKQLAFSRRNNALTAQNTGRAYTWGGRYKNTSEGQRSKIIKKESGYGRYTWKTGLFSGMVKVGSAKHGQYLTFRRISSNSDPNSWMFPGTKPRPIREAVIENTREEVLQLIRNGFEMDLYFMGLGGE